MVLFRALGWALLAAALAVLVNDCLTWWSEGTFRLLSLGELWSRFDYGSFHRGDVLTSRHIAAGLWQGIFRTPALPILAMVGVVLVWAGNRSRGQRASSGGGGGGTAIGSRPPRRRRGGGLS